MCVIEIPAEDAALEGFPLFESPGSGGGSTEAPRPSLGPSQFSPPSKRRSIESDPTNGVFEEKRVERLPPSWDRRLGAAPIFVTNTKRTQARDSQVHLRLPQISESHDRCEMWLPVRLEQVRSIRSGRSHDVEPLASVPGLPGSFHIVRRGAGVLDPQAEQREGLGQFDETFRFTPLPGR